MRYIKLQLAGGSMGVRPAGHGAARRCEDRGNIKGRPLSAHPFEKNRNKPTDVMILAVAA